MTYDFTTLSPDDFENLTADLLSRDWGTRLESFKPGKDAGIDLRNSRVLPGTKTTIIQCKRYAPHKFGALSRSIDAEKKKLDRLRPARYVLATSVALSPGNKDELMKQLSPWCLSPGDIYGTTELNGLLRDHPEVERAHFKLWVSSTALLERVLHARIFNFTEATLDSTRNQLSRMVIHGGFNRALEILRDQHHALIVGNPGIGKTTLARILMCHYLRDGYEPVCVTSDIQDAWDLVHASVNADRKLVVLYDDFLGRLRFDAQRFGKNEEHSLFAFFDKVRRTPNLRFILTTREYIMADARRIHGAFNERADEILKCTLTLGDYTTAHRVTMLFNHLYFSDLPDSRLETLVRSRAYANIVQHENFNPRVVESISTYANSRALSDHEYLQFIEQEFDNPAKLWEHPFRNDISPTARTVLAVLWTFAGTADLDVLALAVSRKLASEGHDNVTFLFTEAIRQLDGNFIRTNQYHQISPKLDPVLVVRFQNPSVEELVDNALSADPRWFQQLTPAIVTSRQVHQIASHALEVKHRNSFRPDFWLALRRAVASIERQSGHVINYRYHNGSIQEVWDRDSFFSTARMTLTRFRIEAEIGRRDGEFLRLQAEVSGPEAWIELLRDSMGDDSISRTVREIHDWIVNDSGWTENEKRICHRAFRDAANAMVGDEDEIWAARMSSLRVLAETMSSCGDPLTVEEKQRFAAAAKIATRTIEDNSDDPYDVKDEADQLEALTQAYNMDLDALVASLRSHADEVAERQNERDSSDDPEGRYKASSNESGQQGIDLDSLFAGLLDR